MEIDSTVHFEQLTQSKKRISVHQGGSSSGKTYNILIWWIMKLLKEKNKTLTIARKTLPALKDSALADFLIIMNDLNLFDDKNYNKTDFNYKLNTSVIQFRGLDKAQKKRGPRRDYLFINEANELNKEDWRQLSLRTRSKIVIDYNPSDEFHFIYDEILTRDDCDFTVTTYKDNPFLENEIVREIERYKDIDENYWKIYGLGERGLSKATIFTNWEFLDSYDSVECKEEVYGIDFGYSHASALVKVKIIDDVVPRLYVKEEFYTSHMTSYEIIEVTKHKIRRNNRVEIIADCAKPEMIEEMKRAGINVSPCKKGPNSVKHSIDMLKKHRIFVDKESVNLIKEMRMYKWKTHSDGHILDEPVKLNDHAIDALRYAVYKKESDFGFAII